jgi:hypothetical protein
MIDDFVKKMNLIPIKTLSLMKTQHLFSVITFLISPFLLSAQTGTNRAKEYPLTSAEGIKLTNLVAESVTYKGKAAIRLINDVKSNPEFSQETMALIPDLDFTNGTIEVELAGLPATGTFEGARGFIGIAFRINPDDHNRYDCFYLRPTNGRAEDQPRRNHTTQYVSHPDFTWFRLRQETPGKYESYVDMIPGEWTRVKIVVEGVKARLYLHGADQPCLIVNDLKQGETKGKIALWIHPTTEGYFRNLTITY